MGYLKTFNSTSLRITIQMCLTTKTHNGTSATPYNPCSQLHTRANIEKQLRKGAFRGLAAFRKQTESTWGALNSTSTTITGNSYRNSSFSHIFKTQSNYVVSPLLQPNSFFFLFFNLPVNKKLYKSFFWGKVQSSGSCSGYGIQQVDEEAGNF